MAKKYDLDITGLNGDLNVVKLKKYIDAGFKELSLQMSRLGYSYDGESRSFISNDKYE